MTLQQHALVCPVMLCSYYIAELRVQHEACCHRLRLPIWASHFCPHSALVNQVMSRLTYSHSRVLTGTDRAGGD